MGRADVAFSAGDLEEAEALYREVAIENPWYGAAAGSVARIAFDRGDLSDETLVWARWSARFNDIAPMLASLLLAEIRLARDEPTEAVAVLNNAVASSNEPNPWPFYLLGQAYSKLGRSQQAVESLEEALRRGEFAEADEARAMLARLQRSRGA